MEAFNLENYLTGGVKRIVKGIWKAGIKNPRTSFFMLRYLVNNKKANAMRKRSDKKGFPIPPFLIASITTSCNLHCKGCYARANHNCFDGKAEKKILTAEEWGRIFTEAEELGISFVLLAGGEPMLRTDVMREAGKHTKLLFPIFTNGTMFTDANMDILFQYPNLLPILSIEGGQEETDHRRGQGTYEKLLAAMLRLKQSRQIFGASITVEKRNLVEVTEESFLSSLQEKGCKAILYVEYVPVDPGTSEQAPGEQEREYMTRRLAQLRRKYPEMIFVSFPGDEKTSGGCLAAGRGFFHINAYGGAEPCPFSAYSDTSLRDKSIKEALSSPLFHYLKNSGTLFEEHVGGCVLFEKEDKVKEFIENQN